MGCVRKESMRRLSAATTTNPASATHVVIYLRAGGKNGPRGSNSKIKPASVNSGTMAHNSMPIPPRIPIGSPSFQQDARRHPVQRSTDDVHQWLWENAQQHDQHDQRHQGGKLPLRQARQPFPLGRYLATLVPLIVLIVLLGI